MEFTFKKVIAPSIKLQFSQTFVTNCMPHTTRRIESGRSHQPGQILTPIFSDFQCFYYIGLNGSKLADTHVIKAVFHFPDPSQYSQKSENTYIKRTHHKKLRIVLKINNMLKRKLFWFDFLIGSTYLCKSSSLWYESLIIRTWRSGGYARTLLGDYPSNAWIVGREANRHLNWNMLIINSVFNLSGNLAIYN